MSRSFSIIKEDIVFSLEPWESGIRATQMNGLAKREQAEKVVCLLHCWMAKPTVCVSFSPLWECPTRRLLSFLHRVDSLVSQNSLSVACKNVCADLSEQRPAVAFVPAGRSSLRTTLFLITTVVRLLALKINIKPLTWHLFSITSQLCLSLNKTYRRPFSDDQVCFPPEIVP